MPEDHGARLTPFVPIPLKINTFLCSGWGPTIGRLSGDVGLIPQLWLVIVYGIRKSDESFSVSSFLPVSEIPGVVS
jgi:hypothetical protein